jgi:zinc protease
MAMLLRSGSIHEPKGKEGVAALVASLLSKGTKKRSALEFAEDLETLGANFSASVSEGYTMVTAKSLSMHQQVLLDSFVEAVRTPAFKKKELNRLRSQALAALRQTVDNPSSTVGVAFAEFLFGPKHPYGQRLIGNKRSLKTISVADVNSFFETYYRPNNAVLAVVGDFKSQEVMSKLRNQLVDWAPSTIPQLEKPMIPPIQGIQLEVIDKEGLEQTQIMLGHQGIRRVNPDFLKLRVANTILGGAFGSRLVDAIRKERGLTYSIWSNFDARQFQGSFSIATFTRHEKVGETLSETIKALEIFKKKGVTKREVKETKALLRGRFPRALETPEALAKNLLVLRFYGIPDSYLTNYLKDLEKITTSEVNGVIKKYFHPRNLKVVLYSDKSKIQGQLKGLGQVRTRSYQELL